MQIHPQRSAQSRLWFDAEVTDNGNGTITIPATSFWLHGAEYELTEYAPDVGAGPFRIWVEKTSGGADYLLDTTGYAEPESFGAGTGSPLVVWRDEAGGDIHVLRSVSDA